jgi:hypothetical protein
MTDLTRPAPMEQLESRRLLAGDVSALQTGTALALNGDDEANAVIVTRQNVTDDTIIPSNGTTSVNLDVGLLADAANLFLLSGDNLVDGATPGSVGFNVVTSSFTYDTVTAEQAGQIRHTGTLDFLLLGDEAGEEEDDSGDADGNDTVTVGNFSIGFDASRANTEAGTTGYFVQDDASDLGILFDVGGDVELVATRQPGDDPAVFAVSGADLLVSPEFAGLLIALNATDADLSGADVGDAQIDTTGFDAPSDLFRVTGLPRDGAMTTVSGRADAIFNANDVDGEPATDRITDVFIDGNGGRDGIFVTSAGIAGQLNINGNGGRDFIGIDDVTVGVDLIIDDAVLRDGEDDASRGGGVTVDIFSSEVLGDIRFTGSDSFDRLQLRESSTLSVFANMGRGNDVYAQLDSSAAIGRFDGGRGSVDQFVSISSPVSDFGFEEFEAVFAI